MPSCVVRNCAQRKKNYDRSISLHTFPKEPDRIKLWLMQTGQFAADLVDQMVIKVYLGKVHDSYRLCSLHFSHDCYHYDGYRRILKKNAIPTIFNTVRPSTIPSLPSTTIPSASGATDSSSEQHKSSAPPAQGQTPSCFEAVRTYRVEVPVVPPKDLFQSCGNDQKPNPTVSNKPSMVTIQLTATSTATKKKSAVPGISEQSRPSTTSIVEVPVSSSLIVHQSTSAISQLKVSSQGSQLGGQLTPVNLQQSTVAPVTFLGKPSSSVPTNSNLLLNTQLQLEATSSNTKTSSSTSSSCLNVSFSTASNPVISTSQFSEVTYKSMTAPLANIPLTVIGETKPSSMTVLPVSVNASPVTQTPAASAFAQNPPSISVVQKPPSSQSAIPDCAPPSKKRKLKENMYFYNHIDVSSAALPILPSQTSGNLIFLPHSTPFVQPSCLMQKPLMVDKGVNTDFYTNTKSCCVATDPMHRRRSIHTQTKISRRNRKIMCTLLLGTKTANTSQSTTSLASHEDNGFNDCSSSSSSEGDNDPSKISETVNLDLVKVELSLNPEVDSTRPTSLGKNQAINIKQEDDSSAGQEVLSATPFKSHFTIPNFDINTKIEPNIKLEEDQFSISIPTQNITNFRSKNPKIEQISPIPSEPITPICKNSVLWGTSAIQTDDEQEDPNDDYFHINELSEDEDESFLVPSDAEDEDDVKRVFQDLDSPVESSVDEEKYLVFESCLRKLIMMIPCMSETKCTSPLTQYRKETVGSYLSVEVRCRSGHTRLLWESQPRHGYQPLGNVLLSAAVLFSGSSFLKSQHMFKLLNVKSIDKTTYYKNQSMYLFPAINHHWKEEQKAIIQSIQERPLYLSGDQQLDNPGFSAKYSVYSLMDVASKKICSFSVDPVTPEVTLEDPEKVGFQKTMGELQTMNADVKMIVTDRSVAIQELLKDNYPGIVHQLDLWHLSKSIGNEILMAAKNKDCEVLYEWVEAIRNHIWWSSCTCCKNTDMLIQKWKSVLQHVTNVHEWGGDSDCKACHHPPLPEEVVNNTNWLEKNSVAYEELKKIVLSTSLLKDLKEVSFLCHTGELEIYHSACLKYRPKTLHFFMDSMVARTQLAALDHNRNVHRVKEAVKNASIEDALDNVTQSLEVSNGLKSWIVMALYKPACHNFLFDIMNDVIAIVREERTFN
ncbi:uncharacterized protein [Phyllobates terribilis]|uniref:uncharacterized protein n=1 Tax=Phyllobates terribilis TaxID=111132 RepID=UPI003CCAF935